MSTNHSLFKIENNKQLSNLYFKAVAEKEVIRRDIERSHEPVERDLVQYSQLDNLVDALRTILGSVILAVP
jgi:hypothetical protein